MVSKSIYSKGPSYQILSSQINLLSYNQVNFTLNNNPIRIVSGSIHYFRAAPNYWRSILRSARQMGLNTITTYVPWNLHEQTPGKFIFSGMLDLRSFLEIAHSEGLLVLLRPGPYICAEWDMGGIPAWVLRSQNNVTLRTKPFLKHARSYFDIVAEEIRPYIGRPIVGLQLENEFGAYGGDMQYMHEIKRMWEVRGLRKSKVLLFTSDNGGSKSILTGSPFKTSEVLKTINLESDIERRIKVLKEIQPDGPVMIGEFWAGWFDHWGETHHTRVSDDVVETVKRILFDFDASVNLYMFFGGTNFGFMNGANINQNGTYLPTTTSYDYNAFIAEDGLIRSEKFTKMQELLKHFWKTMSYTQILQGMSSRVIESRLLSGFSGPVFLKESLPLQDMIEVISDSVFQTRFPVSMEDAGFGYGYIMYRHRFNYTANGNSHALSLQVGYVRDFAILICDGKVISTVDRNMELNADKSNFRRIKIPADTRVLDILVENRGRVNYGAKWIWDRKGLLSVPKLGTSEIQGFNTYAISFASDHVLLPSVNKGKLIARISKMLDGKNIHPPLKDKLSPPTMFRGTLWISPGVSNKFRDETLPGGYLRAFGRGLIWINGFNLGRFHTGVSGPQRSLFVPGSVLKEGRNEVIVLHQNLFLVRGSPFPVVQFFSQSDYGKGGLEFDSRLFDSSKT